MRVRFYATFRYIVGKKEINKEFTGTAFELLRLLCDEYGKEFKEAVFNEEGKVKKYVKIFVNSRNIGDLNGLGTRLKDKDTAGIFPPIAGG